MRPFWTGILIFTLAAVAVAGSQDSPVWHEKRVQPPDLEIGGALRGLPPDSTRYVTRDELLNLPLVNFTVRDDANFSGATKIRGAKLEDLVRRFAASSDSPMVIAICDDGYAAYYPQEYMAAHHPILVLQVNGEPPSGWPKAANDQGSDMGPYMISHPKFTPSFKVLSASEVPQVPWGVIRLEFRDEKTVYGAIAPAGPQANDSVVQDGFRIARQNCLHCHNAGNEGGQKSGRPWDMLGGKAATSPKEFTAYIRSPKSQNPKAEMPGNPGYDDATLAALTAYFRTFAPAPKP